MGGSSPSSGTSVVRCAVDSSYISGAMVIKECDDGFYLGNAWTYSRIHTYGSGGGIHSVICIGLHIYPHHDFCVFD